MKKKFKFIIDQANYIENLKIDRSLYENEHNKSIENNLITREERPLNTRRTPVFKLKKRRNLKINTNSISSLEEIYNLKRK
jgi:transposase-like protein